MEFYAITHENSLKLLFSLATPMKKTYLAVHFTKGVFCRFVDRKANYGFSAKVFPA